MNISHSTFMQHDMNKGSVAFEMDLCDLLRTMRLSTEKTLESGVHDALMQENPNYSMGEISGFSNSSLRSSSGNSELYGCEYLQTIRRQLDSYATTNGEYLEAIFTHREIFSSYPAAHHQCARGFSDIAHMLEQRTWRADRDADTEAVTAFRHEACSIAASMPSTSKQASFNRHSSYVCMMPAM
ncbi:hypothetical protein D9615_004676 [Tricholomella constricta]|uniref:Uncharacterized protein n=1 Tax=Tricholomella constricta TaxID=117010 RepID=A0A8H5HC54_9AGAR|nr:hypothetical protein D9615_004676 [Tricholomella constricta]